MASLYVAGGFQHWPFGRLKRVQFEKLPLRQSLIDKEVGVDDGEELDVVAVEVEVGVGVEVEFALEIVLIPIQRSMERGGMDVLIWI